MVNHHAAAVREETLSHEQLCYTTNHHSPTHADPCSAVHLLLATVTSWRAIPRSLVLNALFWTCSLDQAAKKGEASMNLLLTWITGIATITLFVYWTLLNNAVINGWYLLAMAMCALLTGWFLNGHHRGSK